MPKTKRSQTAETEVRALLEQLWQSWNDRDATAMAELFAAGGSVVGFDGTQINGNINIEMAMRNIFESHTPGSYVGKLRDVRFLSPKVALLQAVAGMIPPGGSALNPDLHTIITLVAVKVEEVWKVASYQNTPARFDGRPEEVEQLTLELRQLPPAV